MLSYCSTAVTEVTCKVGSHMANDRFEFLGWVENSIVGCMGSQDPEKLKGWKRGCFFFFSSFLVCTCSPLLFKKCIILNFGLRDYFYFCGVFKKIITQNDHKLQQFASQDKRKLTNISMEIYRLSIPNTKSSKI